MRKLRHPNVCAYLGVCADPPALLLEYCPRRSVDLLLKQARTRVCAVCALCVCAVCVCWWMCLQPAGYPNRCESVQPVGPPPSPTATSSRQTCWWTRSGTSR